MASEIEECPTGILIDFVGETSASNSCHFNEKEQEPISNGLGPKVESYHDKEEISVSPTPFVNIDSCSNLTNSCLGDELIENKKDAWSGWRTPSPTTMNMISEEALRIVDQLDTSLDISIWDEEFPLASTIEEDYSEDSYKSEVLSCNVSTNILNCNTLSGNATKKDTLIKNEKCLSTSQENLNSKNENIIIKKTCYLVNPSIPTSDFYVTEINNDDNKNAGYESFAIAKKSSFLSKESFDKAEESSVTVEGSPGAVEGSPGAVEGSPGAVESSPGAVEGSPGAVEGSPEAVEGSPGAVEGSSGTVKRSSSNTTKGTGVYKKNSSVSNETSSTSKQKPCVKEHSLGVSATYSNCETLTRNCATLEENSDILEECSETNESSSKTPEESSKILETNFETQASSKAPEANSEAHKTSTEASEAPEASSVAPEASSGASDESSEALKKSNNEKKCGTTEKYPNASDEKTGDKLAAKTVCATIEESCLVSEENSNVTKESFMVTEEIKAFTVSSSMMAKWSKVGNSKNITNIEQRHLTSDGIIYENSVKCTSSKPLNMKSKLGKVIKGSALKTPINHNKAKEKENIFQASKDKNALSEKRISEVKQFSSAKSILGESNVNRSKISTSGASIATPLSKRILGKIPFVGGGNKSNMNMLHDQTKQTIKQLNTPLKKNNSIPFPPTSSIKTLLYKSNSVDTPNLVKPVRRSNSFQTRPSIETPKQMKREKSFVAVSHLKTLNSRMSLHQPARIGSELKTPSKSSLFLPKHASNTFATPLSSNIKPCVKASQIAGPSFGSALKPINTANPIGKHIVDFKRPASTSSKTRFTSRLELPSSLPKAINDSIPRQLFPDSTPKKRFN